MLCTRQHHQLRSQILLPRAKNNFLESNLTPNGLFDFKALLALNSLLLKMPHSIVPIDAAFAIHVHCAGNLPPCLSQYSDWGSPQSQMDSQSFL